MGSKLIKYELPAIKKLESELREEKSEEEASITQAIKDFKLDTMSRSELERKAARWRLELDTAEYYANKSLNVQKRNVIESLKFWFANKLTKADIPNKFKWVIEKALSITCTKNAQKDRPRNGATKPSQDQLEAFRVEYQAERERNGNAGDYGWLKAASRYYGYSSKHISRIFNKK